MPKKAFRPKNEGDFHVVRISLEIYDAFVAKLKREFFVGPTTAAVESLMWQYANDQLKKTSDIEVLAKELLGAMWNMRHQEEDVRYPKSVGAKPAAETEPPAKPAKRNAA